METRFNTGDTVYIPATITNAIFKENKVFYGIKESDSRTEDQVIHNQTAKMSIHVESRELDNMEAQMDNQDDSIDNKYIQQSLTKASGFFDAILGGEKSHEESERSYVR